jgi:hypothetical protein
MRKSALSNLGIEFRGGLQENMTPHAGVALVIKTARDVTGQVIPPGVGKQFPHARVRPESMLLGCHLLGKRVVAIGP